MRLFCWISINSWILHPSSETAASITQNEVPHNPGQPKGVFNNYLLCVWRIRNICGKFDWKSPKYIPKIGVTHAGSKTHTVFNTRTPTHTQAGYTAPLSVWVYLQAVFLAGHSCGNEYQMWFCSHKSKPFALFGLSVPRLKSIRWGRVHYPHTPRLNSFLWNSHRGEVRSWRVRKRTAEQYMTACFKCTVVYHVLFMATGCLAGERPVLNMWEMKCMVIKWHIVEMTLYCTACSLLDVSQWQFKTLFGVLM